MSSSIMSFPDRGPWGSSKWRGNCSGHVLRELFTSLKPKLFVDTMVGSGTSVEVAQEMGIEAVGLDLHSGFDALTMSIAERVGRPADLVFSHPPYGGMVVYSGEIWGKAHPNDLSRCTNDEDFHEKLQAVLLNQREATAPGGHYATLIGDWRRRGRYSSYQAEAIARMPRDELAAVIIKTQHNEMSSFRSYGRMKLPMIAHEYLVVWSRPRAITSTLMTLSNMAREQAQRVRSTWKAIVRTVLVGLGGKAQLKDIYDAIARNAPAEKLASNTTWQAKVRQCLQLSPDFKWLERGVWALAA